MDVPRFLSASPPSLTDWLTVVRLLDSDEKFELRRARALSLARSPCPSDPTACKLQRISCRHAASVSIAPSYPCHRISIYDTHLPHFTALRLLQSASADRTTAAAYSISVFWILNFFVAIVGGTRSLPRPEDPASVLTYLQVFFSRWGSGMACCTVSCTRAPCSCGWMYDGAQLRALWLIFRSRFGDILWLLGLEV